ncbi:MAG: Wzy polymerase domain-containing protein [Gallionella sp.]
MTHISLALVGLMWVLPFLHYQHAYPLTTFDQEWWAVVLGLLATFTLVGKEYWKAPTTPRVIVLPLALILVALLQLAIGRIAYFEQGMLYILYLLFAALMMMLGASLRRSLGLDQVAYVLAIALLIGTELSAAIGIYQHFGMHSWLDFVVVRKISAGLYGNLAQANHYADYIMLGVASLGLLYQQRKLALGYVVTLALPLLFVLTLSGSRTSWLYMFATVVLSAWMSYKNRTLRPLLYYSLCITVGYLAMHGLVQLPMLAGQNVDTNSLRMSDTSGHIRLYLWREALLIFSQAPLLGVGFGQFALHHLELLPLLQPNQVTGLYNNAHNVVLQLAAETGLAGLIALISATGIWLYGLRRGVGSAAHWWSYALIFVITIHALLEYPLWYAYFLGILAFLLGLGDESSLSVPASKYGRIGLLLFVLMGCTVAVQLRFNYWQLQSAMSEEVVSGQPLSNPMQNLTAIRNSSFLLRPYIDRLIGNYMSVNSLQLKEKIAFNTNSLHFIPTAEVVYRQALLLAQDGRLEDARIMMLQAIWSYPNNVSAMNLLKRLAEKDPAHFSALLEFAVEKEQEIARAVRIK